MKQANLISVHISELIHYKLLYVPIVALQREAIISIIFLYKYKTAEGRDNFKYGHDSPIRYIKTTIKP